MKIIQAAASSHYEVHIGSGLLPRLGEMTAKSVPGRKAAIVSDDNVFVRYGQAAKKSLEQAGFQVESFLFASGEASKSAEIFLKLLDSFAKMQLQRSDCVIALGGGVVGDVAGFSAACYLRGIPYIQVPTTLMAMVDSSVGGKTAIDLPAGKNLCGAFHQPSLVLCDTDTLQSLPKAVFRDGCAEVMKCAMLFDPALFFHLEEKGLDFDREWVISRCVEHKARVVAADEFDHGERRLLNFGHTVGHAIEAASTYSITHGTAVAMGMAAVTKYAAKLQILDKTCEERLISLLENFDLPCHFEFAPEHLLPYILKDKKAQGSCISMILPRAIGCCEIMPFDAVQLEALLKEGL